LTFPLVAHWEFRHFVVVEGWYEGGWYINDPATGPRPCSTQEFDEKFTGVVLAVTPGDSFEPSGKRPPVIRRLLEIGGETTSSLRAAAATTVLLLLPGVAVPLLLRSFGDAIDGARGGGSGVGLTTGATVLGLIVALACTAAVLMVQAALSVRLGARVVTRVSAALVDRLLRLPASFHAQRGATVMTQRALVAEQLSDATLVLVVTVFARAVTAVIGCLALLAINPIAGVIVVGFAGTTIAIVGAALRRSRDLAASVVVEAVEVKSIVSASLQQIESIKASGGEAGIVALGIARANRLFDAHQEVGRRSIGLRAAAGLLSAGATVAVSYVVVLQSRTGSASYGTSLAVLALAAMVIAPATQAIAALDDVQSARASLDYVDDIMSAPVDEGDETSVGDYPVAVRGELELSGLTFGYSRAGTPSIVDLSLRIEPGRRVALVGRSGSGKSTVSRLVAGLYEPWSGDVLIDGHPRGRHSPALLADRVAFVDQDATIFAGTLRENITLWDPTVPDLDVHRAIRDACLEDDVASRPGGLDAVLRESGADLSGGQRQRLEIARALVRSPMLLVMDEATSALDPVTEHRIDEAIRRRGISCLIIAHRLSTIRDCDEIIVLDKGRAVERGTHDELMSAGGLYVSLVGAP
jgi:ABC-type bacteriocin/lantibiotic exporter with double-glycine peptidase domain